MPLFDRYHLSQEEAEARLKRALTGDPTRGETGLLAALSANKLDDVQSRLARDASLGQDLRDLVSEHLQKARARWETRRAWSVTLPLPVWDEYAREARITGRTITECLVSAIRRDYERKKGTVEPMETLDQNVRAFHAAATQLLEEARQLMERVGPLQEIVMRLARIEGALGARLVRWSTGIDAADSDEACPNRVTSLWRGSHLLGSIHPWPSARVQDVRADKRFRQRRFVLLDHAQHEWLVCGEEHAAVLRRRSGLLRIDSRLPEPYPLVDTAEQKTECRPGIEIAGRADEPSVPMPGMSVRPSPTGCLRPHRGQPGRILGRLLGRNR
jgi:hypothetical protein